MSQEARRPGFTHVGLTCLFLCCLFFIVHNVLIIVIVPLFVLESVAEYRNRPGSNKKYNVDGQFDTKVPGTYVVDSV